MEMLKYKDYEGSVEVSFSDKIFHGKLLFVNDLVTYEGADFDGLEAAFKEAVDDYLEFCVANNKEPEKPYKGVFNVRVSPELHKNLARKATIEDSSLNDIVAKILLSHFECESLVHNHTHTHVHHIINDNVHIWEGSHQVIEPSKAYDVDSDSAYQELGTWAH